jgi:serine-type D-Ala-D-Ala carboxypeptidase/endopeptidase (penicillin-binding protein 4)
LPDYRRLVALFALLFLFAHNTHSADPKPAPRHSSLERKINSILNAPKVRRGQWGIEVVRLRDGRTLFARQSSQLFLPASNMKLYTTAAALEKLGPDFRFRTTVEADVAPDAAGRVQDLYLVGRGDPTLGYSVIPNPVRLEGEGPPDAALRFLADQVFASGVREIGGNLIADDSYFVYEPLGRGWEEDDIVYGYAAPVTALAFNDNALVIRCSPGESVGAWAHVELLPIPDHFSVNNRLVTSHQGSAKHIHVDRNPGSKQLDVWGEIPVGADPDEDSVSVEDPARWAAELFRKVLEEKGIRVRGVVQVRRLSWVEVDAPGFVPPVSTRVVLGERLSDRLADGIKTINKSSHNLRVEMLLRTMGKEIKGQGSARAGLEAVGDFEKSAGIEEDETVFADGSGLSRHTLIAPSATVKLLRFMSKSPNFPVFLESLPIAGEDGTLEDRFEKTSVRGRIRAKTGTIDHVNALSGYMEMPSGDRLAFSIMGADHPLRAMEGRQIVDRIAVTIFEHFGGRGKAAKRK